MANIVFIIIVLVLQMQKDCLHIGAHLLPLNIHSYPFVQLEWPLGPLVNQTRVQCGVESSEDEWVMSRLQLEPIGFVFIVFFLAILLIQVHSPHCCSLQPLSVPRNAFPSIRHHGPHNCLHGVVQ